MEYYGVLVLRTPYAYVCLSHMQENSPQNQILQILSKYFQYFRIPTY